jgi:hypothetical protein
MLPGGKIDQGRSFMRMKQVTEKLPDLVFGVTKD